MIAQLIQELLEEKPPGIDGDDHVQLKTTLKVAPYHVWNPSEKCRDQEVPQLAGQLKEFFNEMPISQFHVKVDGKSKAIVVTFNEIEPQIVAIEEHLKEVFRQFVACADFYLHPWPESLDQPSPTDGQRSPTTGQYLTKSWFTRNRDFDVMQNRNRNPTRCIDEGLDPSLDPCRGAVAC